MLTAFHNRGLRALVAWSLCLAMVFPPEVFAEGGLFRLISGQPETTAVTRLAKRIDHMERHLDQCGSIVIKTPDVWGESRLMRHRSDVETQLKARLDGFRFKINAAQATRDAAFLASAVALQEAISTGNVPALTGSAPATTPTSNNVNSATAGMIPDGSVLNGATAQSILPRSDFNRLTVEREGQKSAAISLGIEPVIELDQLNRYLQHLNELRRLNEGDDNADSPGYALNLIRIPVSILPGRRTQDGFGAEVQITIDPYMSEEILPLAFKDFVIKGVVDRIGFDVFQIAQRDDIKELEVKVLARQTPPSTPTLGSSPSDESTGLMFDSSGIKFGFNEVPPAPNGVENDNAPPKTRRTVPNADEKRKAEAAKSDLYKSLPSKQTYQLRAFSNELKLGKSTVGDAAENAGLIEVNSLLKDALKDADPLLFEKAANITIQYRLSGDVNHRDLSIPASHRVNVNGESLLLVALHVYDCLVSTGTSPFPRTRDDNYVEREHRLDHGLTMPEVDTLLTRESEAAYEFLSQPDAAFLWTGHCTPELARKVREHRKNAATGSAIEVESMDFARDNFFDQVKNVFPGAHGSVTEALAWQVIVESALINERLVKDMKQTATLKNCPCVPTDWMPFYGPDPCPEARMAFAEYVKCKWPIHVFALDPVTQDQNISDSFSQRREMQMAMAIAASSRMLGGQAMSRFVRRMEYDLETIQLNRTAVGFSHGDNTFGWRFFPRIQAPPVPSNLTVITHDLLIGGQSRDSLARTYKLEPGIRECTALVVMPSFVPQVMVDVRTNWFRLAKHIPIYPFMKRKPDYEDSMDLSREVTELRQLQTLCVRDAHLYRDGEVYRLCKAVERLEDRLPLQTHNVSVPWENDLGGFEVFQSGTQVLGPEIHGWYGAPGIVVAGDKAGRNAIVELSKAERDTAIAKLALLNVPAGDDFIPIRTQREKELKAAQELEVKARETYAAVVASQTDTAVFLVGKNFSVLNCRVIAGGVDVTETIQVINRNLMQVRIPSRVSTVATNHTHATNDTQGDQRFVVVHLATPYGATSRLLIPVAGTAEASDAAKAQKSAEEAAKEAKASAEAARTAANDAKAAREKAESGATTAQKLNDRFPILANWGQDAAGREFTVQGYFDEVVEADYTRCRFFPIKLTTAPIFVDEDPKASPLPTPNPEGIFDEAAIGVNGQLLVMVQIPESNKQQKFGPWNLRDGKLAKEDGSFENLTARNIYSRIHQGIRDDLSRKQEETLKVVVTGYVKFTDDKRVVRLEDPITFEFDIIDKPKDK